MSLIASTSLRVNGAIALARQRSELRPGFGQAGLWRGGAVPREELLFACGGVVQRRVEGLRAFGFDFAFAGALRALRQARERGGVAVRGRADRRREFGAQRRFQVALDQDFQQVAEEMVILWRAPATVDPAPAQRSMLGPRHDPREVADGLA